MLGVWFNTETWTWWLSEEKVLRYTNDLTDLLGKDTATQREIWESVGKVLYVSTLIPESKYYTSAMLKANNWSEDPSAEVKLTKDLKRQVKWWIPMIRLVGNGMPIPTTYDVCPPLALEADSDAAGGSKRGSPGCGIVKGDAWTYLQWPSYVNSDRVCGCGRKFRHKLSFLEMMGHLLHVSVFPEEVRGRSIRTNIDNEGTVVLTAKGRDTRCALTDCLIGTINHVAVALDCRAYVVKVTRCSTTEAKAADALSKAAYYKFRELMPTSEKLPKTIPRTVKAWIENPVVDRDLGRKIVRELMIEGVEVFKSMT